MAAGGCTSETGTDEGSDAPPYSLRSPLDDTSLALVVESPYGRDTVPAATYREQLASLRRNQGGGGDDTRLHRTAVRGYVLRHVMKGEARERELEIDSTRLARRMRAHQQGYEDRSAFRAALAKQGISVDSLRQKEVNTLRIKKLQSALAEETEPPTKSEVRNFRQKQRHEEVRLRYIYLRSDSSASAGEPEPPREQARAILDSLEAGRAFPALARRHSDAPTAKVGGLMPRYRAANHFEKPMVEAIEALRDSGDVVSSPVETSQGLYIVQLVDRRTSPLMSRGEARWRLFDKRRRETIQEAQRSLLRTAEVRVNPQIIQLEVPRG
ncbi:MAG: peptidylprolyl isomerase [Salinibacter sp.]